MYHAEDHQPDCRSLLLDYGGVHGCRASCDCAYEAEDEEVEVDDNNDAVTPIPSLPPNLNLKPTMNHDPKRP